MQFCYPKEREDCYNSQRKPDHYAFAGYVAFKTESLFKHKNLWGEMSKPIVVPSEYAMDIDVPEDLERAEMLIKMGKFDSQI